jgi:hypothetical protein
MSTGAAFPVRRTVQGLFVFLIRLFGFWPTQGKAQVATFNKDAYYHAVNYCRRNLWPREIVLSPDKQILCFSAVITPNMDVSFAKELNEDETFVVRSPGGYGKPAWSLPTSFATATLP